MDYILKSLEKRITYCEGSITQKFELPVLYQAKIEYCFLFWLGYLWNKHFADLDPESKAYLLQLVQRPSIGTVVQLCRRLDRSKELFRDKELTKVFDQWPAIRNEALGHGYVFHDSAQVHLDNLRQLSSKLYPATQASSLGVDLVKVHSANEDFLSGTLYTSEGEYHPWHVARNTLSARPGDLYVKGSDSTYTRLSPFIHIDDQDRFYVFRCIEEPLTGAVLYNQLLQTGKTVAEWPELANIDLEIEGVRRVSANKTVLNTFDLNFKRYIDVGLRRVVLDFLEKNVASVCATVWGHGGVGKTATVQSACEQLTSSGRKKQFDYIIFASAKDRSYNYRTGTIQAIEEASRVNTFEGVIRLANRVIARVDDHEPQRLREVAGRVLLVIDDYETFPAEEKQRLEEFIKTLDINHHKVLITTRANLIIGEEIRYNELTIAETRRFLLEILSLEFPALNVEARTKELDAPNALQEVHKLTSGRPLFIYQFVHIWMQAGTMPRALRTQMTNKEAIEFLYGRVYEYLSDVAKNIFAVLNLAASRDDLIGVVDKVVYVLSMEDDRERFEAGMQELVKLRIVELLDGGFFQVYSKEIFSIMGAYYHQRDDKRRGIWQQRIQQIGKDKNLENDAALLAYANSARYSRSEEEVNSLYRQVLNRPSATAARKLQAAISLANYFFNDRGKKEAGVKVLDDYADSFTPEPSFIKLRASFHWSIGAKSKSITVLADAVESRSARLWDRSDRMEILGLLLTYKSIYWLRKRDELRHRAEIDDLKKVDSSSEWVEQNKAFATIVNRHGRQMLDLLRTANVGELTAAARQNISNGLLQLMEVCIRIWKLDLAREISDWALAHAGNSVREGFESKLARVRKYEQRRPRRRQGTTTKSAAAAQ